MKIKIHNKNGNGIVNIIQETKDGKEIPIFLRPGEKVEIKDLSVDVELDSPQHFTKTQSAWIKKYVILKKREARSEIIDSLKKVIRENTEFKFLMEDQRFLSLLENIT